jgi:hypothetical protein
MVFKSAKTEVILTSKSTKTVAIPAETMAMQATRVSYQPPKVYLNYRSSSTSQLAFQRAIMLAHLNALLDPGISHNWPYFTVSTVLAISRSL